MTTGVRKPQAEAELQTVSELAATPGLGGLCSFGSSMFCVSFCSPPWQRCVLRQAQQLPQHRERCAHADTAPALSLILTW